MHECNCIWDCCNEEAAELNLIFGLTSVAADATALETHYKAVNKDHHTYNRLKGVGGH